MSSAAMLEVISQMVEYGHLTPEEALLLLNDVPYELVPAIIEARERDGDNLLKLIYGKE